MAKVFPTENSMPRRKGVLNKGWSFENDKRDLRSLLFKAQVLSMLAGRTCTDSTTVLKDEETDGKVTCRYVKVI